ncbi:MFS transporter [Sphingomonas sp.]|jgi:hypothetical protein|uniref:MFS transporter n=1 Tax=Sphingomonas sp. TaxID=28214 RepID=UPI002DE59337|nr:MFS transporter [Sphingomonas sp.]HEV2567172.1 MFS transporter [Sphingomonas sp.]
MGLLGSIESLAPALAPILGAGLLTVGDWRLSFMVLAAVAGALAIVLSATRQLPQVSRRPQGSYAILLRDKRFLRYALSQAFVLGGLLTFVFGLPAVIVRVLGGTLTDFIVIQVAAIALFVAAANLAGRAVTRFGAERVILFGTGLCTVGGAGQLLYALAGGTSLSVILALFAPINIGLGLRGPPGFYRAVLASRGDDARGSALVILGILGATTIGTILASPFIERGTLALSAVTFALESAVLFCLLVLPPLEEAGSR